MSRRSAPVDSPRGRDWATADLATGTGLPAAVQGVDTIVHCATSGRARVDIKGTENLVAAAASVGIRHLVYVSITGIDSVPLGYYQAKLACERLIETSGLPYTIVRATQFHDLVREMFAVLSRSPVLLVPDLSFQPVDVGDVATRLVDIAGGDPAGRVGDVAGPEVCTATALARSYLAATGRSRPIVPVRLPGKVFRKLRDGANLAPTHAVGRITFADYLAADPDPRRLNYRRRLSWRRPMS